MHRSSFDVRYPTKVVYLWRTAVRSVPIIGSSDITHPRKCSQRKVRSFPRGTGCHQGNPSRTQFTRTICPSPVPVRRRRALNMGQTAPIISQTQSRCSDLYLQTALACLRAAARDCLTTRVNRNAHAHGPYRGTVVYNRFLRSTLPYPGRVPGP